MPNLWLDPSRQQRALCLPFRLVLYTQVARVVVNSTPCRRAISRLIGTPEVHAPAAEVEPAALVDPAGAAAVARDTGAGSVGVEGGDVVGGGALRDDLCGMLCGESATDRGNAAAPQGLGVVPRDEHRTPKDVVDLRLPGDLPQPGVDSAGAASVNEEAPLCGLRSQLSDGVVRLGSGLRGDAELVAAAPLVEAPAAVHTVSAAPDGRSKLKTLELPPFDSV